VKFRSFGKLGWMVSEIGFGSWAIGGNWGEQSEAASIEALHRALDLGCNFIDTAQAYGNGRSERIIARVLAERPSKDRVYVATKIPPAAGSWPPSPYDEIEACYGQEYLQARVKRSLQALNVECLDLVQLHTWSRSWNRNPVALDYLRNLVRQGLVRAIGVSSPEHDQSALVDLMKSGHVDCIQVAYNIFDQEAQCELLPVAGQLGVAVIVRVPLDESSLAGRLTAETVFAANDFRSRYFAGDRLARVVRRVDEVRKVVAHHGAKLPAAALKFSLRPPAVTTVIPGMRSAAQAEFNVRVADEEPIDSALEHELRKHNWRRGYWYAGK
jgi:aryl-alcohol dehydrogenase-like predicted oxidoreductase